MLGEQFMRWSLIEYVPYSVECRKQKAETNSTFAVMIDVMISDMLIDSSGLRTSWGRGQDFTRTFQGRILRCRWCRHVRKCCFLLPFLSTSTSTSGSATVATAATVCGRLRCLGSLTTYRDNNHRGKWKVIMNRMWSKRCLEVYKNKKFIRDKKSRARKAVGCGCGCGCGVTGVEYNKVVVALIKYYATWQGNYIYIESTAMAIATATATEIAIETGLSRLVDFAVMLCGNVV